MSDAAESRRNASEAEIVTWVNDVLPKAVAYACSLIRDSHAAEDIVHDCVCRLLDRQDRYDLVNDGFKLLLRSISNATIDRARRLEPWSLESDDRSSMEQWDRQASEPIDIAIYNELNLSVEKALLQLPLKQRAALELKSLGFRLSEIAESLDISESNAGVLLHRARAAMAKELSAWMNEKI